MENHPLFERYLLIRFITSNQLLINLCSCFGKKTVIFPIFYAYKFCLKLPVVLEKNLESKLLFILKLKKKIQSKHGYRRRIK